MMNKRNIAIFVGMAIAGAIAGSTLGLPSGVSAQSQAISIDMKNTGGAKYQHGSGKNAEEIAAILNLTKEELRTQVRSGKTLAQIATTQKVDIKLVINAIVASIKTRIAEEVSSGKITQAIADEKLANSGRRTYNFPCFLHYHWLWIIEKCSFFSPPCAVAA